ncbi:uncharacterized protein LOC134275144, partial [Saccostrea cucullata]|uniref:uncharacterized protein LOC134275144 n=1 Tax=Saccostrea cuccullata TaxID=36930 RepID=UPI002ED17018
YSGDSCQLLKDFCTGTTNCLYEGMPSTGTCTNLPAGGFNCACQTGYSGGTCQTKVTRCSNLSCGSEAMCNEEIGCYCPEGKIFTENIVCKIPSDDFDIYFDTQMGEEGASTTAVLPGDPEHSDLSFMMMVKFNKDQNVMEKEDAVLLRIRDFIEIKNNSITFMNGTSSHSVKFEYYGSLERIDDGTKWNFIAVSWRRDGKTTVYVKAGLLVFDSSSVAFKLPKVFNIEIGKRYGGRISQVKFWNSSIANADMLRLSSDRNHKPAGATLIHGWYNYKMNKGAMKKITTQIENDSICDVPACSPSDKIKPKIKACPVDDARSSSKRVFEYQLPTISSMFDNFNESQSLISHKGSFTWGDYSLMFLAADENGNTAMCRSKLYVKYNADCPPPRKPPSLIIGYCSGSKDICKLSCPGNQVLSIPVPKYKMCSKLGVYTPLKPRQKFALPSCGGKTDTQIQIEVSLKFSLAVVCDVSLESPIERKLKTDFKDNVYQNWNNVCSDSDCSNVDISSKCVTGKEQMTVAMKIKNLRNSITKKSGSNTYTAKEVFRVLIFEDAVFIVDGVGGAKLLNDQVVITDIVSCPDGNMVIEGNCVECSNGTFYNSTSQNCEYCPVGTYGDEQGLTSCKSCGDGKTTLGVGNYDIADCVAECPVGQFLNGSSCSLCQKHFYQHMAGQDYCLPCPLGKKTSGIGSNSSSQCF